MELRNGHVRKPYVHKQKPHFQNNRYGSYGMDIVQKPYVHKQKTHVRNNK